MSQPEPLYIAHGIPVFQNVIYEDEAAARSAITGNVTLVQCDKTGLVFNASFDSSLVDYNADYQNEQAHSRAFQAHLEDVLSLVRGKLAALGDGVEIGCGKAHFLELARADGIALTGYDPAYQGDSDCVVKEYYSAGEQQVDARYFVMRHVLEHIENPYEFLAALAETARDEALIYIEVPAFEWIVQHRAFFDIFYEHCNYFTLESLSQCFTDVVDQGYCFGGQYLYIVARVGSFVMPTQFSGERFQPLNFTKEISETKAGLRDTDRNYIWGAGAKGVTMSNLLVEEGIQIAGLIDINPRKQNRFTAKAALPILSPESAIPRLQAANVLIMNPNYASEIAEILIDTGANQTVVS